MKLIIVVLVCSTILQLNTTAKAQLTSKCGVNGTSVSFHCPGAVWWYINQQSDFHWQENITLLADTTNTHQFSDAVNATDVTCKSNDDVYHFAVLIVTDSQSPEPPLYPTLLRENKTSLFLGWQDLGDLFINLHYEVVLTIAGNTEVIYFEVTNETFLILDLKGYECRDFNVSVSVPGNCKSAVISGSLLRNPPYPTIQNMQVTVLDNSSVCLTWQHPENIFDEPSFNYSVTAIAVNTESVVEMKAVKVGFTDMPREVINVSDVGVCEEVNFTVSLDGDCRSISTTIALPIFSESFASEVRAEVTFLGSGELKEVDIHFKPPMLCEFQTASYVLTFTDGNMTWSTDQKEITDTSQNVKEEFETGFMRDRDYTVTVTVCTEYGNISSSANLSTHSAFSEAILDSTMISHKVLNATSVCISWEHPTNTLQEDFTYTVTAVAANSGTLKRISLPFTKHQTPFAVFNLKEHLCEQVVFVVEIFNSDRGISIEGVLPTYPTVFAQNVTVEPVIVGEEIKDIEFKFMPPKLCEFQTADYTLTFTDGNVTWSTFPKTITDTSEQVKEEIETGFEIEKNYTVTVTVITMYGKSTSSASFNTSHQITGNIQAAIGFTGVSVEAVGGIAGGVVFISLFVLLCGFVAGVVVVYLLRQRKVKKRQAGKPANNHIHPTVTNPIYETGENIYEVLPDLEAENLSGGQAYTDMAPALPSARSGNYPTIKCVSPEEESATTKVGTSFSPEIEQDKLHVPRARSTGDLSSCSQEDCYTVMSPAGDMTMLPRNRHSGSHSMASGGAVSMEGRFTLHMV